MARLNTSIDNGICPRCNHTAPDHEFWRCADCRRTMCGTCFGDTAGDQCKECLKNSAITTVIRLCLRCGHSYETNEKNFRGVPEEQPCPKCRT